MSLSFIACDNDDNKDNEGVPTEVVSNMSFSDTDKDASKIGGVLSWTAPVSIENITKYVIYQSNDGEGQDVKLGEVPVGTNSFTIPAGTDFSAYLLVVTSNTKGESASAAKIQVTDVVENPQPAIVGVYLLNSGKSNSNNSTLDYYNPVTKELKTKVFSSVNGRGLGDTANDMIVYGSKMYIAVTNSNTIEVTDLNAKSLKTIAPKDETGQPQSPRHLAAYEGKVYVTLFDGHLAAIDTTSMEITKQVQVGPNPEEVCAANGKLYVANSGGYNPVQDSTLSVIDAATFTVDKNTLKVIINPSMVRADSEGYLYVMSLGNYGDIKASVQRLDPKTGELTVICSNEKIAMSMSNDKLYILSSESNASTGWMAANTKYIRYDAKMAKVETENFITDGTTISKIAYISVDPLEENVYMTAGEYTSTGDVYIYSAAGKKIDKLGVSGINPMGAYFIVK
ncbi:hypothetical protein DW103_02850 [Parabacteroides sp. AM08-6]|nr:hypothetical protein DW103_02850 [Parabacteroides sp. AM08-6]